MNTNIKLSAIGVIVLCFHLAACDKQAPTADASVKQAPAASTASDELPDAVYWGDTHVHTSYSFDAGG